MADEADYAAAIEQSTRDSAIAAARSRTPELKATGFCLWCTEPVAAGRRFCDADCAEDFEKRVRA